MTQTELIQALSISNSSFRRWRSALNVPAKESYLEAEVELFNSLKEALDRGQKFKDAIAELTGHEPNQASTLTEAIAQANNPILKREAKAVAQAMATTFTQQVWQEFFKTIKSARPSDFDDAFVESSLALDGSDAIDAYFLEAADED